MAIASGVPCGALVLSAPTEMLLDLTPDLGPTSGRDQSVMRYRSGFRADAENGLVAETGQSREWALSSNTTVFRLDGDVPP